MDHTAYMYRILCSDLTETGRYAALELKTLLDKYSNGIELPADGGPRVTLRKTFDLAVDPALEAHAYRLRDEGDTFRISGGSQSALLTAVYAALTRMGVCFDTGGDFASDFSLDRLTGADEETVPFCRNRGVRQHINFPMDISAYTLADAKAYIYRLARMGMNAITFHSYTGQWHGVPANGTHAGHFFYGQMHKVPAELKGLVDNRALFCIPEIEPVLYDKPALDAWARYWLRQVIAAAKTAGMTVTLSVELLPKEAETSDGADADAQLAMIRDALISYPQIDVLELITPEGGGGQGDEMTLEEIPGRVKAMFGITRLPYVPVSVPKALPGTLESVRRALNVYRRMRELTDKPVAIGMYVMCKETVRTLNGILDQALPDHVLRTILPAHGATAVRDHLAFCSLAPTAWQNTMIYSWAEFDGNMYLLQNSAPGVAALLRLAQDGKAKSMHGVCLNHWRTAENAVTLAYAAQSLIAPCGVRDFYIRYAAACGIADADGFAEAMETLGQLDEFDRDRLFNIGFCYLGCWMNPGLSWIRGWKEDDMSAAAARFEALEQAFSSCLVGTAHDKGRQVLRLLINRTRCSVLHIRAIQCLKALSAFTRDDAPGALTGDERVRAAALCDEAEACSLQYVRWHVACMPDRGSQGTAVSYIETILVYIQHIRECFVEGAAMCTHNPPDFDAPPPPDIAFTR